MKYIILTFTIEGLAGGPTFTSTKVNWLKKNGYDVVVFDHYGGLDLSGKTFLPTLLPFKDNRMLELFFPPMYYSKRQRKRILNHLCEVIGTDKDYVVESHTGRMSLWGEILAEHLHAKHLIFDINENVRIKNKAEFDFLSFKLERDELFGITSRSIIIRFGDWKEISDDVAKNHMFDAMMDVGIEDVSFPDVEKLPKGNFKILSFGRRKPYFDSMIEGIIAFASRHANKTIVLIMLGDVHLTEVEKTHLTSQKNISHYMIPPQRPIPRAIFDYCDVVIATSGCAEISYNEGYKTISMNVENSKPLGLMGYTTINSVYEDNIHKDVVNLETLLEEILCEKKYDGEPILEMPKPIKGLEWQMTLINDDRQYWNQIESIPQDRSLYKRILESMLLRLGGLKLIPSLYSMVR